MHKSKEIVTTTKQTTQFINDKILKKQSLLVMVAGHWTVPDLPLGHGFSGWGGGGGPRVKVTFKVTWDSHVKCTTY